MSEAPAAAPDEWRRTSPLSFVVGAVMSLRNAVFPALAALVGTGAWRQGWVVIVPTLAAIGAFTALFSYLAWRKFRYRLGDTDIRVERGLLNRTARSVPYERIQDVSLEQSLVPRLFGMVDVKFETGAGGKDEVRIRYVTAAEAEGLREAVRAHQGAEAGATRASAPVEEPCRLLFAMDFRRLATFGVFEFSLVVFAVLAGAAQQFEFLLPFDIWNYRKWIELLAGPGHWLEEAGVAAQAIGAVLAVAVLALVGLATGIARTVQRDYGFRLEESSKGLRRRRGLFTRSDVIMPVHRVQALKLSTGIVRRRFGWHGLSVVSLAQDAKAGHHVVVPFGTLDEIAPVIAATGFALPAADIAWRLPSRSFRLNRALFSAVPLVLGAVAAGVLAPRLGAPSQAALPATVGLLALAGVLALRQLFLSRYDRHALDDKRVFARRGWLAPRLDIASRLKLQSVEIVQGPLARRRGYAALVFGVAGGSLEIGGIPLDDARAIRGAVLGSIAAVDFSRLPG
ncbi:MAG: PH domain-containing protein [Novosphingobium sp.]|nr:PH domain-containing protein [Novosphingobium sp.]